MREGGLVNSRRVKAAAARNLWSGVEWSEVDDPRLCTGYSMIKQSRVNERVEWSGVE